MSLPFSDICRRCRLLCAAPFFPHCTTTTSERNEKQIIGTHRYMHTNTYAFMPTYALILYRTTAIITTTATRTMAATATTATSVSCTLSLTSNHFNDESEESSTMFRQMHQLMKYQRRHHGHRIWLYSFQTYLRARCDIHFTNRFMRLSICSMEFHTNFLFLFKNCFHLKGQKLPKNNTSVSFICTHKVTMTP